MGDNVCPFCGAEEGTLTGPNYYKCDTHRFPNGAYGRGEICKSNELAALRARLAEAEEKLALWRAYSKTKHIVEISEAYDRLRAAGEVE